MIQNVKDRPNISPLHGEIAPKQGAMAPRSYTGPSSSKNLPPAVKYPKHYYSVIDFIDNRAEAQNILGPEKLNYKNPSVYPKQEQRDSLKYFSSDIICRY